jgi:hypothetical protein
VVRVGGRVPPRDRLLVEGVRKWYGQALGELDAVCDLVARLN